MKITNSLWLIASAFFFSCLTIATKLCGQSFSFFEFMFAKYVLVTLLTAVLLTAKHQSFLPKNPGLIFLRCLFGVLTVLANIILIFNMPAAIAQSFNYTASFWVVLALCFSSRSFSIAVLFPLFLGFGGILLVLNPQMNGEILTNPLTPICVAYGLLAALGMLVLRKLGEKHEATLVTTFYFSLASAMVGLIGSLCTDDKNLLNLFADPFLLLAVLLTLLFQIPKTFSWQYGDSTLNSIYLFLGAPFVVILGWLFLNEMPTAFQMLGIVFIVGSAVSSYFIISKLKKNR